MDRGHKMINDANDWQKQFVISSSQHTLTVCSDTGPKQYPVSPECKSERYHVSLSQVLSLRPPAKQNYKSFLTTFSQSKVRMQSSFIWFLRFCTRIYKHINWTWWLQEVNDKLSYKLAIFYLLYFQEFSLYYK